MSEPGSRWAVLVHGGAKTIAPELWDANREGCRRAAEAAAAVLRDGGAAVVAVEAAVRVLEDDPVFNAGYGSVLNADGAVEMDAAVMDGATLELGAVAAVTTIRNPVRAAARLLGEPAVLLVAGGAELFAEEAGLERVEPGAMISPEALASEGAGHDTVGCVAVDARGHVAAATSTGGLAGTRAGRVGDTPLPGCGIYADHASGAVALSGDGEAIARTLVAARVALALEGGAAPADAARLVERVTPLGGEAGAIVLDPRGRLGVAHTSEHFALGLATDRSAARGAITGAELGGGADD